MESIGLPGTKPGLGHGRQLGPETGDEVRSGTFTSLGGGSVLSFCDSENISEQRRPDRVQNTRGQN